MTYVYQIFFTFVRNKRSVSVKKRIFASDIVTAFRFRGADLHSQLNHPTRAVATRAFGRTIEHNTTTLITRQTMHKLTA